MVARPPNFMLLRPLFDVRQVYLLEKLENLDSLFLIIVQLFVDDSTSLLHLGAGQISATLFLRLGAHSRSATNWNKKWS
jgi:hypothetical protein